MKYKIIIILNRALLFSYAYCMCSLLSGFFYSKAAEVSKLQKKCDDIASKPSDYDELKSMCVALSTKVNSLSEEYNT